MRLTDSADAHMPEEAPKRLIVVGDRVLIVPEAGEERTNVGLYLPATAVEARQVQGGRIIATGPGTPMTEPASMDDEPWKIHGPDVKYLPMQAGVGDYALFFRREGVGSQPRRSCGKRRPAARGLVPRGGRARPAVGGARRQPRRDPRAEGHPGTP